MMNVQPKDVMPLPPHDYNIGAGQFARTVGHEKLSIISPKIRSLFKILVDENSFKQGEDKILDIGCGPFYLALPFIRDGVHVDGVDTSQDMLEIARKTIEDAEKKPSFQNSDLLQNVRLVNSINDVEDDTYQMAMMNFVHQCAPTKRALNKMFSEAASKVKEDGQLILTGAHPDYLHLKHACCEYDVDKSSKMIDGQHYTGRIFNEDGDATYELKGDYFWKLSTISSVAQSAGFEVRSVTPIEDVETPFREAQSPAYFIAHFQRAP